MFLLSYTFILSYLFVYLLIYKSIIYFYILSVYIPMNHPSINLFLYHLSMYLSSINNFLSSVCLIYLLSIICVFVSHLFHLSLLSINQLSDICLSFLFFHRLLHSILDRSTYILMKWLPIFEDLSYLTPFSFDSHKQC